MIVINVMTTSLITMQICFEIMSTLKGHLKNRILHSLSFEPRSEKTGLRGFRPGPTQTGLYSHKRRLEA